MGIIKGSIKGRDKHAGIRELLITPYRNRHENVPILLEVMLPLVKKETNP